MKMTEQEARQLYDEYLDELVPLEGVNCLPFSILLSRGDEIAYECGFNDWCDAEGLED